ncbi:Ribonuclease H-like domain containing protein [Parasponia andersonii]|uniref:Ribonuclease H-like domain containing protein n=1 Tax=Parasponia andersonii TaxID=3476 RepID=A0A2P5AEK2_PARAD|nr:Ribonuclease H-like domain containing protein [Parasponia andersonii]
MTLTLVAPTHTVTLDPKWEAPPTDRHLKLNVDAAMHSTTTCGIGIGAMIRDSTEKFCDTLCSKIQGGSNAFIAERLALREGLRFVLQHELLISKVESDCLKAIFAINSFEPLLAARPIISDIIVYLSKLGNVVCSHIPCTMNKVAHSLASVALRCNLQSFWLYDTLPCVYYDVWSDITSFSQ